MSSARGPFSVDIRAMRDQLRHELFHALNGIEDIVGHALDHVAAEAVVYGASEQHDFRTDAVAAKAITSIAAELERATNAVVRKFEDDRELVRREPAQAAE